MQGAEGQHLYKSVNVFFRTLLDSAYRRNLVMGKMQHALGLSLGSNFR